MLAKSMKLFSLPLALVAVVFLMVGAEDNEVPRGPGQPIEFNHSVHELGCDMCHRYVYEAEFAGRPFAEICAACHEEALKEGSAEESILLGFLESGREIPWRRIYKVPSHVYYSHRRHTIEHGMTPKIECVECHGAIGTSTSPPGKPLNKLTMKFCINCHEERGVTTDCNACHR